MIGSVWAVRFGRFFVCHGIGKVTGWMSYFTFLTNGNDHTSSGRPDLQSVSRWRLLVSL